MKDLRLQIERLERENSELRHRLKVTNQFVSFFAQSNVDLTHQLKASSRQFEQSLSLLHRLIKERSEPIPTDLLSQAHQLFNRN